MGGDVTFNLMIAMHGIGPIEAHCGTCAHLVVAGRAPVSDNGLIYECRKIDREKLLKFGRRIFQHRLSWPACSLYIKGESKAGAGPGRAHVTRDMIKVSCPQCGRIREVSRSYIESFPDYDALCKACKYLKRINSSQIGRERPVFMGCHPVSACLGKRCIDYFECPNHWTCLSYAADRNWDGFVGSLDSKACDARPAAASGEWR